MAHQSQAVEVLKSKIQAVPMAVTHSAHSILSCRRPATEVNTCGSVVNS